MKFSSIAQKVMIFFLQSKVFDMLVDNDGNYLMGGHTTVGTGVVNWDYLALKVNSQTRQVMWRKTFGQPRGFNSL